jgi:hypothetical protein
MINMKHLTFTCILCLAVVTASAQQVIATSGGTEIVDGIEVSWTLGEALVMTLSGNNTVVTQGFHQPGFAVTAVTGPLYPELEISLFPNPTRDVFSMQFSEYIEGLHYLLYDLTGRVLEHQLILSPEVRISMSPYAKGAYFLKVTDKTLRDIQTFKVVRY